jgi:ectoine hydroxylase-related dioxygenase (phytanoyl-CoA dioxygenase family)
MIIEIETSPSERSTGLFLSPTIQRILEALHTDGIVILKDIVDPSHLDSINEFMLSEVDALAKVAHRNFGMMNIQHAPPLLPKSFLYADIYWNSFVLQAVKLYLGEKPMFNFISGNTALARGPTRQPVHSDANFHFPHCPFCLCAYIPLIDVDTSNGMTELWPGTHTFTRDDQVEAGYDAKQHLVEGRKCVQPTIKKGSVILRDFRLWHAGMPNPSDGARCLLALGFCSAWYRNEYRVPVPEEVGAILNEELKKAGIQPLLECVSDEQYSKTKHLYNFTFEQQKA